MSNEQTHSADSLKSLNAGLGDLNYDKSAGSFYSSRELSDDQLSNAYRNSWIARKIIDIPALDSLRKGRDWQGDKDQIAKINNEEKRLKLWQKLLQCKTQARLWGGAAIIFGCEGIDYQEEFNPEEIKMGGLQYLTVLNRRQLTIQDIIQDPLSEFYGQPEFYEVSSESGSVRIHPSRLVVQIGMQSPDPENHSGLYKGWGDSILQAVHSAMTQADSTAANISSLVFEANIDVFGIPNLMSNLATDEYREKLLNRFAMANVGKSINKSLIRDTEEEYERHAASFANLDHIMQSFLTMASGAADIPLTRFLGQSSSGLANTGEWDMKNYYDRINSTQTLEIQPAMWRLDEALIRSALGERPEELYYNWTPLEQVSEKEQSEIALRGTQAAEYLTRTGLFMPEELRESVSNQLIETGSYPGLGEAMKGNEGEIEFDLGEEKETKESEGKGVSDATPRTLYLRRNVINGTDIVKWYKKQGLKGIYKASSMHVTVVYSKKPIDWMKMGQPWEAKLEIPEGGPRLHEKFGDDGEVIVLLFKSNELDWRNQTAMHLGATTDFDEYQSHISLTIEGEGVDLKDLKELKPYQGKIVLGAEIFEEVDLEVNWESKVEAE